MYHVIIHILLVRLVEYCTDWCWYSRANVGRRRKVLPRTPSDSDISMDEDQLSKSIVTMAQSLICHWWMYPSPPVDIIGAMMIVRRIRGKIIRTVLCCVMCDSCAQWYAHTYEQFLQVSVGLGLGLVFVHLFRFSILYVFVVFLTLSYSCVGFSFFSGAHLRNDPFCFEWDVKPLTQSIVGIEMSMLLLL